MQCAEGYTVFSSAFLLMTKTKEEMIKEILKALATKFEGLSENVLTPTATRLAKSASKVEDIEGLVNELTIQQVIDSYSDKRATEATQTAVNNYEKKHNLKDGKVISADEGGEEKGNPNQRKNEEDGEEEKTDPALKAVLDELKSLKGELAGIKQEKLSTSRSEIISNVIKDLPEFQKKVYAKIDLTSMSEEDFNSFREETEESVKDVLAEIKASGAKFGTPPENLGRSTDKEASEKEAEELVSEMDLKF